MVIIEMSLDQIIWMLDHYEELNEEQKLWIDTFKKFMFEDFGGEDDHEKQEDST